MPNVQLPGSNIFDSQLQMKTITQENDVSMANNSNNICIKVIRKNIVID